MIELGEDPMDLLGGSLGGSRPRERCRCCVLGGYLAWRASVMKDQCIHLLCTMLCRVVPCRAGCWHTMAYLEGSAVQPFSSSGSLASQGGPTPTTNYTAFKTASVGEMKASVCICILIPGNQFRVFHNRRGLFGFHILDDFSTRQMIQTCCLVSHETVNWETKIQLAKQK